MWRGSPINTSIVDSSPTLAMQTCAAGLWTGLTSPSRPWFRLQSGIPGDDDLDQDAQAWLEDTQQRLYAVLAQSNFYNTMAQAFQDVATFGTAPVLIYEDAQDVIRCYLSCAGEYYLGTGARQSDDVFYREFTFTVAQIVEMFGIENCPPDVRGLWNTGGGSLSIEFVVAHAIEPNSPLSPYGTQTGQVEVVPRGFTYRELYWLRGQNNGGELSRRGFHDAPFMVARWATVSNDAYGRSPGMDALGDTKQLQLETVRKAEFIEKLVRPPMGANVEMKNEPSSLLPGHVTFADTANGKKGFWPLIEPPPQALTPMIEDIKEIKARIDDCFFVNLFMAISRMEGVQPRNQLELTKRDLERLQGLGPFIHMFETEFADRAIHRILGILDRKGLLKPKPPSIANKPLKIDYISIMKLAQQSAETVSLKDFLATGGEMSSAAKAGGLPDPLRIVDLDKAYRKYGKLSSIDPDIIYTDDQVQQHDQARNQVVQQHAAMAATAPAVAAAKSLSETPLDGNTALSAMLGGQGRPGAGA